MTYRESTYTNAYKFIYFLLMFPILLATASFAADTNENDSITSTEHIVHEVVVQGEAVEKSATVTVVTAEQIKERGIRTVAQALEMVPGTHVRVGGKSEAYIRIRGFRQREVAVLIDGVPVSSPYDGQLDLNNLPVQTIERIDVVKGASSVLYGANAMGGVINIITRKGNGNKKIHFNAEYGSGKSYQLGTALQGQLGKIRYFIGGNYQDTDHYSLSNNYESARNQDEGNRSNSDKTSWTGRMNLEWDMGKNSGAGIGFTHIDLEKGLPHHESDRKAKYWRFTDWNEGILDLFYHKRLEKLSMETKVYYQYFRNVLAGYDDGTYTTQDGKYGFHSSLKDHAMGGDLFLRFSPNKSHLFKTALRFRSDAHRQQDDLGDDWERYNINTLSLPLEAEWKATQHITLVYGASFDVMFFKAEDTGEKKNTTAINPQVSLLWSPTKKLNFKGSVSLKTRFPSMKELFSSTSGNPDLDPMKSTGLEAGLEYFLADGLSVSLVGFYNDISDLINRVKKNDPYINIDKAEFKGIEAGLEWRWTPYNRFYASYTNLKAVDKSDGGSYIQYRPKHKVDAGVFVKLPARFRVNLNVSHVSPQLYYDDDDMERELDAYTLMDIRLSRRIWRGVEIYVTALNIFDVNYYESEGYPREGRSVLAGMRFDIGK
ncbi:MAG: TonB-dependent receptor [bacterium]|nr:TonB-dependent receptor [bacterium]